MVSTDDREPADPVIAHALAEPDPAARAKLFEDLAAQHGDPRPGVGLRDGVPDLLWRRVPAGRFSMGGDPLALGAWAGREVEVPTEFWMAAYPVTVAQYQAFIDGGGYGERWRACWTGAGWSWKGRYNLGQGLSAPLGWDDPLAAKRVPNHPVAVDWYEAHAFGNWLEALRRAGRLRVPAELPETHVVRLPDEAEREWAARYPDGRLFPWGDVYQSGYANIDETAYGEEVGPHRLWRVTPVGIYPAGRQPELGLYDLCGNLNEWCLTEWSEGGYSAQNDPSGSCHRVVRGGHLHNGVRFARAASRTWGDPDPDDQYDPSHGFRLVIGPPLPSRRGQAYEDALRWRREHGG